MATVPNSTSQHFMRNASAPLDVSQQRPPSRQSYNQQQGHTHMAKHSEGKPAERSPARPVRKCPNMRHGVCPSRHRKAHREVRTHVIRRRQTDHPGNQGTMGTMGTIAADSVRKRHGRQQKVGTFGSFRCVCACVRPKQELTSLHCPCHIK
jgi:hypothetical protein